VKEVMGVRKINEGLRRWNEERKVKKIKNDFVKELRQAGVDDAFFDEHFIDTCGVKARWKKVFDYINIKRYRVLRCGCREIYRKELSPIY